MAHTKLKQNVQAITMSEAMRTRIAENIRKKIHQEKSTVKRNFLTPAAIAAALVLCLPLGTAAAGLFGQFIDIHDWRGAIVGTKYENATNEINVHAQITDSGLTVTAILLYPERAPYLVMDSLAIGSYSIVDANGTVLAEGGETAAAALDGRAQFQLPLDSSLPEDCILKIHSFIGGARAEQPLPISGDWEIPIQY